MHPYPNKIFIVSDKRTPGVNFQLTLLIQKVFVSVSSSIASFKQEMGKSLSQLEN